MKMRLIAILLTACCFVGCARKPAGQVGQGAMTQEQVSSYLSRHLSASLPSDSTDVYGQESPAGARIRFSCSDEGLRNFLSQASRLIPEPKQEETSLLKEKSDDAWWRPQELQNTRGSLAAWDTGNETAVCWLLTGPPRTGARPTVYIKLAFQPKPLPLDGNLF